MLKSLNTLVELNAAGFRSLAQAKPRHFAAIGRFIVAMSNWIDVPLNSCLQAQLDLAEDGIARILIGGMSVGDVIGAIRRIVALRYPDSTLLVELNELFNEIEVLREHRNNVVHRTCMVCRNRLAFHNALYAKTESALDVRIYSLRDLAEFELYAQRLVYRLTEIQNRLVPNNIPIPTQAYLAKAINVAQLTTIIKMIDGDEIKDVDDLKRLQALAEKATTSVAAYADIAIAIAPDFEELKKAALGDTQELSAALKLLKAPSGAALRDIPLRLQKNGRTRQKDTASARRRTPPSRV